MTSAFKVFLLCLVTGALPAVAAADDLYWGGSATGGAGTRVSSVNNWNTTPTGSAHPTSAVLATAGNNFWVNRTTGNLPTITSTYQFPATLNDFNIGVSTAANAAGKVSQTSGTVTITNNLVVGSGAITGNPTSTYNMTGGKLSAASEIYVGQAGGCGSLTIANATVTNGADPLAGGSGWTQIGREGGAGTLTMSGTGNLSCGEEFRAGWMGGTATVNMSGTSTITARGFQNMGRDAGSKLTVSITGAAKMVSTYNEMSFGSNGGTASVTVNGTNSSSYAAIDGGTNDAYWVSFGRDTGSYCSLNMLGYSKVSSGYGAPVDIGVWSGKADAAMNGYATIVSAGAVDVGGYGGTATLTMDGNSTIHPTTEFHVGSYTGCGTLTMKTNSSVTTTFAHFADINDGASWYGSACAALNMSGSATLTSTNEVRLGAGGTFAGTLSDSSVIHADGNLHIGLWGGSSNVTMNPGTSMYAGNEFHINSFGAGNSSVTMTGGSITVNSGESYVGWGGGANGTLSMGAGSTFGANNNVQFGRNSGSGTLIMTSSAYMWCGNDFRLGIDAGAGTLSMSGTSVLDAYSLGWIAAHPNWDSDHAGTAYVNITGSAKLMSHFNEASFGSGGGHADVYMNGTNSSDPAAISCGGWSDGYWVSFGRDSGSSATLEMRGNSAVVSNAFTEMGVYGASCVTNMYNDARILDTGAYGRDFNAGSYGASSHAEIYMHNNASISTVGKMELGGEGTFILEMNDASVLHADSWTGMGRNGGNATATILGGTVETNDLQIAYEATGAVTVGGGSSPARLHSNNGIELGWENDESPSAQATLTIAAGGTVETQYVRSAKNGSSGPLYSILNFNGGVLKATASSITFVSNTAGSTVFELNVLEGGAIIDTAGHDVAITEAMLHAGGASPDGGVTKLGSGKLTLMGASTYNGTTRVQEGALSIVGSITSDVVVTDGATLAGSGFVHSVTGGAGAILRPDDPSTLTLFGDLNWGGTLAVVCNGSDPQPVSRVDVGGNVTLNNATFDFVQLGGDLTGGPYVFLSYAGILDGTATALHVPTGYFVQYGAGTVSLAPVPEPSTLFLLALGLLGFAYARSRRK
jgi:fibronectin-binding autotransporter adhesin